MNVHARFEEQVSLAQTYAEDGAFFSAARVLRRLASELEAHLTASLREIGIEPPPAGEPELLAPLKSMVAAYRDDCPDEEQPSMVREALTAIANAEAVLPSPT